MKFKVLLFIALFVTFSCVKVNAASNTIKEENQNVTVGNVEVPVLEVDITWGNMEFILNEETNFVWKNSTKTYELEPLTYSWTANNNHINIKNNSYKDVKVDFIYNSLYANIEGNFNKKSEIIKRNDNMRFELNLSGKITNGDNNTIKVGSIELLIS